MLKIKKSNYFILIFILLNITLQSFACQDRTKLSSVKANMHTIQTILETYAVDWGGVYPKDIKELEKEARKKDYWKELKNPYNGKNINYITLGKLYDKDLNKSLIKKKKYTEGSILYIPFTTKEPITSYKIYGISYKYDKYYSIVGKYINKFFNLLWNGLFLSFIFSPCGSSDVEIISPKVITIELDFIHEKGKIFYLTNS